jgi:prepilin-type N-terminal cleavage/methylation domain-containing protein
MIYKYIHKSRGGGKLGITNWKLQIKSKNSAFTLVELIVVIAILAILWTISFIALQGFATDARDAKRITDIRGLLEKISTETTKWVSLKDFIQQDSSPQQNSDLIFNSEENKIWYQWTINFETLREDENKFADPNWNPYLFAYAEWQITREGKEEWYSFMQLAAIMEKSETAKLVWNYFQYDENDSPSLFKVW